MSISFLKKWELLALLVHLNHSYYSSLCTLRPNGLFFVQFCMFTLLSSHLGRRIGETLYYQESLSLSKLLDFLIPTIFQPPCAAIFPKF